MKTDRRYRHEMRKVRETMKTDRRYRHEMRKVREIERRKARANKWQGRAFFGGLA